MDVFEGVARCIVCRENPARRCAERYCEEIERKRKTDIERSGRERETDTNERKERERERRGRDRARKRARLENGEGREPSSGIDLVVGSAGGGAGTQVLLFVYRLSV